jgi:hypothetical protein
MISDTGNLKQSKKILYTSRLKLVHVKYLLLPQYEYILPELFRIKFSNDKLNPFRFLYAKGRRVSLKQKVTFWQQKEKKQHSFQLHGTTVLLDMVV